MKNKKYLALMIAMTMTAGLAACGTTTTTTATTASAAASAGTDVESAATKVKADNETKVTARVDSVSGNTINVTLGELGGRHGGPGEDGQARSDMKGGKNKSSDSADSRSDESQTTDGQALTDNSQTPPELPDGQAPTGDGQAPTDNSQTPPELPDGQAPTADGQTPPELPDDQAPTGNSQAPTDNSQTPPDLPNGQGRGEMNIADLFTASDETATYTIDESVLDGITLEEITEGIILTITLNEDGSVANVAEASFKDGHGGPDGMGGPNGMGKPGSNGQQGSMGQPDGMGGPGGSAASIDYSAVTTYSENTQTSGETYTSTGTDENAVLVDSGAEVKIDNATVTRTSSDSSGGDNASFYGVGAALLAKDGTLYVEDSNITTDASGGAGVFAYGDGTAYVEDTTINTTQNASGGIHVAGGGTLYAWDLDVTTNGGSAAAIRSDRGGGTMVVEGGSYTSNGSGSPAVYTTADITVEDADLTATGSEAVCIEGLNTLRLFDCNLTGNMPDDDQNDITWDVIVYQSMSGDSEIGTGNFSMVGGTLTSKNGGLFYTTNTSSEILLSDVDINYSEDNDFFLQVTGNTNKRGWGSAGANGAQCTFTGNSQDVAGKIVYDSISTLDFYLTNGSTLTGYFVDDETWAGNGGDGYCNVYVSSDSVWTVTEDCTIDALYAAGKIVDADGNNVTVKGEDGTVYVQGNSGITVTVSSYSTEDKSADALQTPSYSDYEVAEPDED